MTTLTLQTDAAAMPVPCQTQMPKTMLITWDQMHELLGMPNIERRIYRDIKDILRLAYTRDNPQDLLFRLHNDPAVLESGGYCVEIVNPTN